MWTLVGEGQEQRPWGEAEVGLVTGDEKTIWLKQNDP